MKLELASFKSTEDHHRLRLAKLEGGGRVVKCLDSVVVVVQQ